MPSGWPLRPAVALAAAAALLPIVVLSGWLFDSAMMRGLGAPNSPIHPMTAFIFFLMAIAATLLFAGHRRAARILLIVPLLYLALILFQHVSGIDTGIARLLFGDKMALAPMKTRPITPVGPLSVLALLLTALHLLSSGARYARLWAGPMTSVAAAATLLLLAFTLTSQISAGVRFVGVTVASGTPILLLCAAMLVSLDSPTAPDPDRRSPWHTLQRLQPALILCAVVPSLALIGMRESAIVSDAELYYLIAMANLLVVSALLVFVTHRADVQNRLLAGGDAKLNSILDTAPDALIVSGDDLVIRTFSGSTPLLWQCDPTTLVGESLHTLFEKPIDAIGRDPVRGSDTRITTGRRFDGTTFPAELRLGVAEQDGERVCVAFIRDLSERMAMEDQLNGLNFQLMHLSRQNAMGELAGDIAHEINQPLTAATNYATAAASALEKTGDGEKAQDYLKEITAQLLRAGGIISRLRAFLANREIELRREPLNDVVQDAVNLVKIGSRRVSGALSVHIPDKLPQVYVDRIQVQQVLVNLLRNAFEACEELDREPDIHITARLVSDHLVEIAVADNGAGLPEGYVERLGQRFYSTKGETGLGIGLNISKRIVEAHGGTLTAADREAGGAVFRFTIPAAGSVSGDGPIF